ncbi:hypothetical protein [Microbulbifer discodermiae]|uniref:hypothetical protein n=1 Tax=Microbulbifer sp. 2201CG32-9 TaxID=3232309 RepID=UPI00345C5D51
MTDEATSCETSLYPTVIDYDLEGTGSNYDLQYYDDLFVEYIQHRIGVEIVGSTRPDVRTTAQHLTNIRGVFNLPMTELGDLFKVSRQSVYKWLRGTEPDIQKSDQIHSLSQIADQFKTSGVMRAGAVFKIKVFGEKSLYQLFKDSSLRPQDVSKVISEARRLEADYESSALKNSKAPPRDEWRSYLSIPGGPEPD